MTDASLRWGERPDRGLGLMIGVSAALHVLAVATLIFFPDAFKSEREPVVSYTVDLVAPNRLGGTNLPGKRKPAARAALPMPPAPAPELPKPEPPAAKVEPPPPPPPVAKVEPPPPPPPPKVEAKPEPPPLPKVEPKKPEPKPEPKKAEPPPPPPPKPKKVEPKKADPPKDAISLKKDKTKKEEPPKKVEAKKETKPEPPKVEPKPDPKAKLDPKTDAKANAKPDPKAEPPKPVAVPAVPEVSEEEARANREKIAAQLRESQLQAAIDRAKSKAEAGSDSPDMGGSDSGPLSIGPAEGAGGKQRSAESILYEMSLLARAKQNWVWPGPEKDLQVELKFGIADNGDVLDVQVTKSSGDSNYDASAVRAVKGLSPLPPPPETIREEFREVILTFIPEANS